MVWKNMGKDDDRWLYLPALDLVKRIAASDERTSFVGSHFFYEDVSGRGINEDKHELLEETNNYYVMKSTPKKPGDVEFAYYKNWIHKTSFLPVKTEYYDKAGKVYRTYEASKVENISGFPTVVQSKISDSRIGGETIMKYNEVKYDVGTPDDIFTERYLRTPPRAQLR
jgi:outer membrane lipoprotein-sorting protein